MKRIVTLKTRNQNDNDKNRGCGACQTTCQSASKTSRGISNQSCVNPKQAAN